MSEQAYRKRPTDLNRLAASIVASASGEEPTTQEPEVRSSDKNPAAVALGRLGGLKGGKSRAEKLTSEERSDIAKKAAKARWGKDSC